MRTDFSSDFSTRGMDFVRISMIMAKMGNEAMDRSACARLAKQHFGPNSPVLHWFTRSNVDMLTTADGLAGQRPEAEFFAAVAQQSIIGRMLEIRHAQLRVPFLALTGKASVDFVGESRLIPVSKNAFTRGLLPRLKVAAITVVSNQLFQIGDPVSEQAIRNDMLRAAVEAIDEAFIDPSNAGIPGEKPKSITHGLALAGDGDALTDKTNYASVIDQFDGDLATSYWIMRPKLAARLNDADHPDIGPRGGSLGGIPVICSRSVPDPGESEGEYAMLVDAAGIVYGDGLTAIDTTQAGSIIMSSWPENSSDPLHEMVSMFQTESTALRTIRETNWDVARPGSVLLVNAGLTS